jgi:hypothetical protein
MSSSVAGVMQTLRDELRSEKEDLRRRWDDERRELLAEHITQRDALRAELLRLQQLMSAPPTHVVPPVTVHAAPPAPAPAPVVADAPQRFGPLEDDDDAAEVHSRLHGYSYTYLIVLTKALALLQACNAGYMSP